ncbi:MAG: homocysteine S-methyltransferase family protein [Butyrivibrio sp.]|uniref:homocysteine S-methyltransferase family protein n=1 Tax=Butyrivibrio sp. TaxID=28121 RepID=UPI0025F679E0|nr:homocysteine S-methyltransferase family protein [Butyrivibrio sp.]MCR5772873.1 homocysteine S-methyltransferase family protein [Butyrivibrio sp.]
MTRQEFFDLFNDNHPIFLDGATGTNLMKAGMPAGVCPEDWILGHRDVMIDLQRRYAQAGSNIVYAPTFTASRIKLKEYGLENDLVKMNTDLIKLSKEAVEGKALVAGDITMTGRQLSPVGDLAFEDLIDVYKEQIKAIDEAGADLLVVETMMSLQECRAAMIAAKEVSDLPVMVTLTFEGDGKTLYGTTPECAATVLEALGAVAVGANCSTGPDKMAAVIKRMASVTNIPIIAKPNAGMPSVVDGKTVYDMQPSEFAADMELLLNSGASIIGGCCGSTPDFIKALKDKFSDFDIRNAKDAEGNPVVRGDKSVRRLTSERELLSFSLNDPFMIVGERINPTGKKKLQAQLREGTLDMVCDFTTKQEEDGAAILDVNVGMSGIDEHEMMMKVLNEVTQLTSLPICIDSSNVDVMEEALRWYPGRALINSISLEEGKAERCLPLAKKYGAMFILLPVGRDGIPTTIEEKIANIKELTDMALSYGLTKSDIVVDGLVATVGADSEAAIKTLETIEWCYENGYATICGLSNISFGLPQRSFINTAFLTMAIDRGLTMAISNPSQELLVNAAFASDLLKHKEESDLRYITRMQRYDGDAGKITVGVSKSSSSGNSSANGSGEEAVSTDPVQHGMDVLYKDVLGGNKRNIAKNTQAAIDAGCEPSKLLNDVLMPAINDVGAKFDKGTYFLPQLIASAEAMKLSIAVLEPLLKQSGENSEPKGTVIIATVHGDVHDIGKNLVSLMLGNCGYRVIDLGKDVESELIVETAMKEDAKVIALSALMTTTMVEMKNVIKIAKERGCTSKIIIGGACVTEDYAKEIEADGYSTDAADCVRVVNELMEQSA